MPCGVWDGARRVGIPFAHGKLSTGHDVHFRGRHAWLRMQTYSDSGILGGLLLNKEYLAAGIEGAMHLDLLAFEFLYVVLVVDVVSLAGGFLLEHILVA